jgi:hypothetical protein
VAKMLKVPSAHIHVALVVALSKLIDLAFLNVKLSVNLQHLLEIPRTTTVYLGNNVSLSVCLLVACYSCIVLDALVILSVSFMN